MLLSLTLTIPGYLILEQVDSFYTAALSLLYLSVAAECFRPASITATINYCEHEDQHTKSLAVNRLAVNLGMTVGPAVGGFLATINYSWLFYANAFGALLALICVFGYFWDSQESHYEKTHQSRKSSGIAMARQTILDVFGNFYVGRGYLFSTAWNISAVFKGTLSPG